MQIHDPRVKETEETSSERTGKQPHDDGGRKIDHAVNKKYRVDFVSELGCKQSIDDSIKYRIQKLTSKVNDILLIADAPQLGAEGTSTAAIKLFEAQVMSGLLFNCESWIGITEAPIDKLQSFQDNFLKKLLHLPVSTPQAILHWDCGMEMIKWRIAKSKLMFVRKMRQADCDNICKRAILNEIIIGTKGLASE